MVIGNLSKCSGELRQMLPALAAGVKCMGLRCGRSSAAAVAQMEEVHCQPQEQTAAIVAPNDHQANVGGRSVLLLQARLGQWQEGAHHQVDQINVFPPECSQLAEDIHSDICLSTHWLAGQVRHAIKIHPSWHQLEEPRQPLHNLVECRRHACVLFYAVHAAMQTGQHC